MYYLDSNWKVLKNIFISVVISAENSIPPEMRELPELIKKTKTYGDVEHDKFQGIQVLENGFASAKINILSKLKTYKFLFFKKLTQYT